jgi:hypothetical protein
VSIVCIAVIYVVDSADSKRLDEARKELERVCADKDVAGNTTIHDQSMLVGVADILLA